MLVYRCVNGDKKEKCECVEAYVSIWMCVNGDRKEKSECVEAYVSIWMCVNGDKKEKSECADEIGPQMTMSLCASLKYLDF